MTKYTQEQIKDSVNRVVAFIEKNNKLPLTVRVNKDNLKWVEWKKLAEIKDAETRLKNYIKNNKKYPAYVNTADVKVDDSISKQIWNDVKLTTTGTSSKVTITDETYNYFSKVFGKYDTIDECLSKVKEKGYAHYYNDKYSNKEAIDRIKKGLGINCTDACQVFWHIGKALGYEVRCLHVKCSSGEGHVRLQFKHKKHTSGNWISRDPAAVLSQNGKPVTYNWCTSKYTLLATNPSWFMQDINK